MENKKQYICVREEGYHVHRGHWMEMFPIQSSIPAHPFIHPFILLIVSIVFSVHPTSRFRHSIRGSALSGHRSGKAAPVWCQDPHRRREEEQEGSRSREEKRELPRGSSFASVPAWQMSLAAEEFSVWWPVAQGLGPPNPSPSSSIHVLI